MRVLRLMDIYTRRARLAPALLVSLPLAAAVTACFPSGILGWGSLWGLVVWSGGTLLLAQIGRDLGKRKERLLFEQWGGRPTALMLRHSSAVNSVVLNRIHGKLAALTGVAAPTAEQEAADPARADAVYDAWTTFLREKTRNHEEFALVFDEVCSYGFRRNLWGLKPVGVVLALSGLAAALVMVARGARGSALGAALISGLLLVCWFVWFTPDWVRMTANAYAERLLGASEKL